MAATLPSMAGYGLTPGIASLRSLQRANVNPHGPLGQYLKTLAWRDVVFEKDDFAYATIDATFWVTNAGTGATAFAVPGTPLLGGAVTGATGTNGTESNRCVNLYGSPIYAGDKNCGVEFRLKVGAASSNVEWACGFIDTHTTITTPIPLFGDIDTPTLGSGIGDAALVGQDTAETLTTAALVTLGSTPYSAAKTAIGTFAPTATTYFTVRIQLIGDDAYVFVNDSGTLITAKKTSAIEGGTLVRPIIAISGPTATTKTWDIDYIARWQDR
jgi:hypothetical protein